MGIKKDVALNLAHDALMAHKDGLIKVSVKNNMISFFAGKQNIECRAFYKYGYDGDDFDVIVNGKKLVDSIRYTRGEEFELSQNGIYLRIQNEFGDFVNLKTYIADEFMSYGLLGDINACKVAPGEESRCETEYSTKIQFPDFCTAAGSVMHCCEETEYSGASQAVFLLTYKVRGEDIVKTENAYALLTCNGYCVSVRKTNQSIKLADTPTQVIPISSQVLKSVCSILDDDNPEISVSSDGHVLKLADENHEVVVSTCDFKMPAIQKLFSIVPHITTSVNKDEFNMTMDLCLIGDKNNNAGITITDNKNPSSVGVSSCSIKVQAIEGEDKNKVEYHSDVNVRKPIPNTGIKLLLSAYRVKDAVSSLKGNRIYLHVGGSNAAFISSEDRLGNEVIITRYQKNKS